MEDQHASPFVVAIPLFWKETIRLILLFFIANDSTYSFHETKHTRSITIILWALSCSIQWHEKSARISFKNLVMHASCIGAMQREPPSPILLDNKSAKECWNYHLSNCYQNLSMLEAYFVNWFPLPWDGAMLWYKADDAHVELTCREFHIWIYK